MDINTVLTTVWSILNSPAGITTMATIMLWLLNKLATSKPLWVKYEGTLIAAVKAAEKVIPDDSSNKSVARLDEALKYTLKIYEQAKGRQATSKEVAELTDGLQIVHAELEGNGQL